MRSAYFMVIIFMVFFTACSKDSNNPVNDGNDNIESPSAETYFMYDNGVKWIYREWSDGNEENFTETQYTVAGDTTYEGHTAKKIKHERLFSGDDTVSYIYRVTSDNVVYEFTVDENLDVHTRPLYDFNLTDSEEVIYRDSVKNDYETVVTQTITGIDETHLIGTRVYEHCVAFTDETGNNYFIGTNVVKTVIAPKYGILTEDTDSYIDPHLDHGYSHVTLVEYEAPR